MSFSNEDFKNIQDELLGINNKLQEAIDFERNGKWYLCDTKLQGLKQKVINLYLFVQKHQKESNEDNQDK